MQQLLDAYGAGVQIQGVAISQSVPPAAVNDAFHEVSAAQQQAQILHRTTPAPMRCSRPPAPRARPRRSRRSMPNIAPAPEVTRRRMYYETMERVLQQVDTTIVEAPGVTPYLPLPEIQRRAQPAAPAQGGPAR